MATQLISREEAAALGALPFGKKHPIRILIEKMKTGETLKIDKADFTWKRKTPNIFCLPLMKKTKAHFEMEKLPKKAGWLVTRVA